MKKECVQIVFSAEISRKIAMYKSHYIQYTLFAFLIVLGYVYGLVAKMDTSQVSGFERLTVLYVVYYIVRYNIEVKRKCSIMFLFIILIIFIVFIVLLILYVYSQKLDYKIISNTEEFFEFYSQQ